MTEADTAMDRFMKKPELIEEQVRSFTGLLNSGILEATHDEGR